MAYYSEIENIRAAFFQKEQPEWEFFRGTNTNKPLHEKKAQRLIDESPDGAGLDESWNYLEEVLNRISYKGGKAVLFVGPKEENASFVMPISLSKHTMSEPPVFATGQRGGLHYGQGAGIGARSYDQTLSDKMKIYDLERRLEDAQFSGTWSAIGQTLLEKIDPNTIVLALSNLISGLTGKNINIPTMEEKKPTAGEIGGKAEEQLENSIERLMETISRQFNNDPEKMKKLFDGLNDMVEKNPAILKQLAQ